MEEVECTIHQRLTRSYDLAVVTGRAFCLFSQSHATYSLWLFCCSRARSLICCANVFTVDEEGSAIDEEGSAILSAVLSSDSWADMAIEMSSASASTGPARLGVDSDRGISSSPISSPPARTFPSGFFRVSHHPLTFLKIAVDRLGTAVADAPTFGVTSIATAGQSWTGTEDVLDS